MTAITQKKKKFIDFFSVSCKSQINGFFLHVFKYVKYHIFGSSCNGSVPKDNKQPFKCSMSTYIQSRQNVNMNNFDNLFKSVIRLIHLFWNIWNITRVSESVMVQFPKTMSNLSNLLCPIGPRKPNSTTTQETGNAVMGTMGTILPISAR